MKRLIINADDFGMTGGINRAIAEAHRHGTVTSTTMMANGGAFADAVQAAHASPSLSVGAHIVLMNGTALAQRGPSLAGADRKLRPGFASFAAAALTGGIAEADVMIEITAQVERLRAAGLPVTHMDSHKHAHIFPAVFRPLLRAAAELGITAVRNPFEPEFSAALALLHTRAWKRFLAVRGFALFAAEFRREARRRGIRISEGTVAVAGTARWRRPLIERLLRELPEGSWELICHPAYPDEEFHRFSSAGEAGRVELEFLTAPWFRAAIDAAGIQLISYPQL